MTLKFHRTLSPPGAPLALVIGNFDGVHRGHQAILAAGSTAARAKGLTFAAMTFHPLPREYFARLRNDPSLAPARLMSTTEKLAAFVNGGVEHAYIPRFDAKFCSQSPDEFVSALTRMNLRWLMVGEDFRFGAKRAGDTQTLRAAGLKHGFQVETMPDVVDQEKISSSAIRHALADGQLDVAARMLGRPYSIVGRVTHGKRLGRTLGFPTANITLTHRKPALSGVYAVQCRLVTRGLEGVAGIENIKNGPVLNGVANLGTNPVVSIDGHHHLEVFLFDFAADVYGQRLACTFIEKIRDEQNFASLDALKVQMHDDVSKAKHILRLDR
ncbi:MAG: bifunctional riboflavin kinase/FAD synthetase [Burkholderiales bacterium]|nr:bifunctional riboflavin kinase/FAD synthetase [Burkholderiales bacterium]